MRTFKKISTGEFFSQGCNIGNLHFGTLASDADYAAHGLYRVVDAVINYDDRLQTISGYIETIDELNKQVLRTPIITELPLETKIESYRAAIREVLDEKAKAYKFDNILSASTYAGVANEYQQEAKALLLWRAKTWKAAEKILADVTAGIRPAPSIQQLINELPVFTT